LLMVEKFHHTFVGGIFHRLLMVEFFHLLAYGGKNSTLLVGIFPPSASRWENSTKKGGCGMVEFFHPCIDGGKIPPCRWRYWTTFIGGIFHHIRLQCTMSASGQVFFVFFVCCVLLLCYWCFTK